MSTFMPLSFDSFGLHPTLLRALQNKAYARPTPIQQSAIPEALAGKDVLASAQTGSGKTAAFALPILHRLATQTLFSPRRTLALVLVPTRELAMQVGEVFKQLGHHLPLAGACAQHQRHTFTNVVLREAHRDAARGRVDPEGKAPSAPEEVLLHAPALVTRTDTIHHVVAWSGKPNGLEFHMRSNKVWKTVGTKQGNRI